jgi:hypothetical protein
MEKQTGTDHLEEDMTVYEKYIEFPILAPQILHWLGIVTDGP